MERVSGAVVTDDALPDVTLAEAEAVIERGVASFIEVGNALTAIRDGRLYLEGGQYTDFDTYCRERWGWQRAHAYRLIEGATIVRQLSPIGDTVPKNETHVRELVVLKEEPTKMATAWSAAQERATTAGKPVTAAMVKAEVAKYLPPKPKPEPVKPNRGGRPKRPAVIPPGCVFVADKTPLEWLQHYYALATAEERLAFNEWRTAQHRRVSG